MEVDNERLRIYAKPDYDSEVVCEVQYLGQFVVNRVGSTEDFYMVYTSFGLDGYCSKAEFSEFSKGGSAWKVS